MFKYLINDQEVTFNSEEERLKGIAEAEANNYSIELLEEPEFEASDAPESAFSQIMQGESPEDFITDPVESADAVSETVAQKDTVLPSEDTSLDLPVEEDANKLLGGFIDFEDNTVLEEVFSGNKDATKDLLLSFKDAPNITTDLKRDYKAGFDLITLTYTDPDTGIISDFNYNTTRDIKPQAKKFKRFLDKYVPDSFLGKATEQAEFISKEIGAIAEADVTAELGNRNTIFNPRMETQEIPGLGADIRPGRGEMVEVQVFPYEKELEEQKKKIAENFTKPLTEEELTTKAKDQLYAELKINKRNELLDKKTQQYFFENEDARAIFKLGSYVPKKEALENLESDFIIQETNYNQITDLGKSFATLQNYVEGVKTLERNTFVADGKEIILGDLSDGSEILTLEGGAKITQNQLDLIEKAQVQMGALASDMDSKNSKISETSKKLKDLSLQANAAGLNYSIAEKSAATAFSGLTSVAAGIGFYGAKAFNGIRYASSFGINKEEFDKTNEWLNTQGARFAGFKNDLRNSFVRDVSLKEGFDGRDKNFGRFVMQEISTQAPILVAMAASGGTLAPYVVGAYTAGEKGMDIAYEDSLTGKKTSEMDMFLKSTGVGLANGVFTGLTTNPILQRGIKGFKSNKFGKEYLLGTKDYVKNTWKRALIYDNGLELSGEIATNTVENAIDGRGIFENADHVAVSSLGFSFVFSTVPFLKGVAVRQYVSSKDTRTIDKRAQEILNTVEAYQSITDKNSEAAKIIKDQLSDLQRAQDEDIKYFSERAREGIDDMGSRMFVNTSNRVNKAKATASKIVNDNSLTYKQKQNILAELENQFANDKESRDLYLSKEAFGDNFVLLKAENKVKYDDLIGQAQAKLNSPKVTNAVLTEASNLYRAEVIRDKFETNKKVNKDAVLAETKQEAIDVINNLNADETTKRDAIENIKNNGSGVNVLLSNGKTKPIAVVESMVRNSKEGVMEHEIGHGILDIVFKDNVEGLIQMSNQVKSWLESSSPALAQKIKINVDQYQKIKEEYAGQREEVIANEYMANFFELVAENRIDLASDKNASFAALAGYMMQDVAKGTYEYDFKGPKDFAAFAVSIGNGIKNGTVNISKLSEITAQAEKLRVEEAKPTKKPKTRKSMSIEALEQAYFDLQDQAAEDPNNLALYERMEKAGDALDAALAAPVVEATAEVETIQDAPKEAIVRPKADKSKRKYSLDKEVKKEIEPKIAEAQKLNKELIAQEKKINADAIAEIEAIDDKVESRTSREKRIADLKNKPLTAPKPPAVNKLEREITAALETPINKAVNIFTRLYYDKIAKNATAAVTRDEFMQSAKAEITSLTINEFKPETINRAGEEVINDIEDIIFQRGGLRLRNLAQRLGVISKEQGIARGADALTKIADTTTEETFENPSPKSVTEQTQRKVTALLASDTRTDLAKEQVKEFWVENEGNTKVENFKKLPNLINNILAEMFGVTEGTLTARSGNLNREDYLNAIKAFASKQAVFTITEGDTIREARVPLNEVGTFQDSLNEKRAADKDFSYKREANESIAEALLRFLPKTSADDYTYASGRKGRFSGKSTGLPKNLLELAYKVEGRKTTGIGNIQRAEQKLSVEEILDAIGAVITTEGKIAQKTGASGRSKEGQTLLGLIKLLGRMATNELSRTETDLDPMTKLDLIAGKNDNMYSRTINPNFVIPQNNLYVEELNNVLQGEFGDYEKADLADVVDYTYKYVEKQYGIQAARKFTYEFVEQLKVSKTVSQTELDEVTAKAIGDSYGKAYKYVIKEFAYSIEMNKLKGIKTAQPIIDFIKLFSRSTRNLKLDNITTNEQLYNKLAEDTGLGVDGLKKLGITLEDGNRLRKVKGIVTDSKVKVIAYNGEPIFSALSIESIRRVAKSSVNQGQVNFIGDTMEADAEAAKDLVFEKLLDYKSKIDSAKTEKARLQAIAEAKGGIAMLSAGQLTPLRKMYKLKDVYRTDKPTMLEHETSVSLLQDKLIDFIDGKISLTELEIFADDLYVNIIPKTADAFLDKIGDAERYKNKDFKKDVKGLDIYNYQNVQNNISNSNSLNIPNNLRTDNLSVEESVSQAETFDKAMDLGNSLDQEAKGISVWDFDDTLAKTKSSVLYTMPDGTTGKLDAAEFAKKGDAVLAEGAEFDFSEFSKVVKGSKGPFFEKAMARNKKFGNENVYILTARPANSALAIHEFLKGIGLDIPLANITGLANSDPQAKANWVLDKFAEGYNNFYFADDHIGNVNAVKKVLDVLDVKSKVQQARVKFSLDLSKRFNEIIEEESGIEDFKTYQDVKAGKKGAKKSRFKFFIPPSAEDFLGLLYTTLPKGKKGESAMAFYKEHLLDPYGKAVTGLRTGRITIAKNYRALKKELGIVPRTLKKRFKYEDENGNMKESLFTKEEAIRVYTWDAQGFEIPGLSNVDLPILVNYVNSNPDLKAFADKLLGLNKNTEPKAPTESWPAGTITSDLLNTLNTDGRKQLLEVWQQNVDAIFTPTNLNKLEAAYGKPYVTALKDSLRRMRTGRNSTPTNNSVTDGIVRWLNAAVGNIMFLNRRSAVLQLISFTNFINFEGNNLYQAGKAFANQPQYWKDWVYLMNSDYLVDRRDGLKINVNEADIATTAKENGFQGVLAKILQVGFIPTKMADSAAIATGGASFYRNRVNALIKGGMNKAAAEKQAMQDFVATAEVSQQSSDPSKISKQQSEPIGRIILAFANTPSQYARIIKRAAQDLKNGRGDAKTHLSRIVYYGLLQNLVFNFLQQAMFTAMMGDDDEEELTEKQEASQNKKMFKTANSMTDGILRGIGLGGAVVSTVKNLAIKLYERSQKTRNQNMAATALAEVMKLSPPISSKLSKVARASNSYEWEKKEMEFDKMSLKHPYVTIAANTVAAATGFPADRAVGMAIDAVDIASDETETWMKPLIALGWPKWQLMSEEDTKAEKEKAKERFKELKEDKEYDKLDSTEKRKKALKDLSKKEQVDMLWNAGVSRTEIKNLSKEADRIDKLMDIQNKEQFDKDMDAISQGKDIGESPKITRPKKEKKKYSPAMEKRRKVLKDLSKQEQIDSLWNRGLSKSEIRELTSEESRINKIIELQNKKRKNSLK